MTPDVVVSLMRDAGTMIRLVAGPLRVPGLVIGLAVSGRQAVTPIQESSLRVIPKLVAVLAMLAGLGQANRSRS